MTASSLSEVDAQFLDELFSAAQDAGDTAARDQLLELFAPLVATVAAAVARSHPGVERADLVADGTIGLMDAIDKFEARRGLLFRTYATRRVRGAMIDAVRAADWVPRAIREHLRDVNAAAVDLQHRHRRPALDAEVAAELEVTVDELHRRHALGSYTRVLSLDLVGWEEASAPAWARSSGGVDDDVPAGLDAAIAALPQRGRIVIALYYWERLSMAEIGQVLGVSESRISQILGDATRDLRGRLLAEG